MHENPDLFIITKEDDGYHIFSQWRGGYLSGDAWRYSTNIVSIEESDRYLYATCRSGTKYSLKKDTYSIGNYWLSSMLEKIIKKRNAVRLDSLDEMVV